MNSVFLCKILIMSLSMINIHIFSQDNGYKDGIEKTVRKQGTISFILHTGSTYRNGYPEEAAVSRTLLAIRAWRHAFLNETTVGSFSPCSGTVRERISDITCCSPNCPAPGNTIFCLPGMPSRGFPTAISTAFLSGWKIPDTMPLGREGMWNAI